MHAFASHDGQRLFARVIGTGHPLVVLPGGPGRDATYLGDLGGLAGQVRRRLVVLEMRGTGASAFAAAPSPEQLTACRADHLVRDVEALRESLGVPALDLMGHSAGGIVATMYAAEFPDRLANLVLLTPGAHAVGAELSEDELEEGLAARSGEPWHARAVEAVRSEDNDPATRLAAAPFSYGRWDAAAERHAAAEDRQRHVDVALAFHGGGSAYTPERTRRSLLACAAPVTVLVGGEDLYPNARIGGELAACFPDGLMQVLPGAGHFPWLDDPKCFVAAVGRGLGRSPRP